MGAGRYGGVEVAESRPSGDGLGRWLVGGLVTGAILLVLVLGAYALGSRHQANSRAAPSAAATTAPATSTAPSPTTEGTSPSTGDPTAGKVTFAQTCSGCHLQNGTAGGGVGPKLQGLGLTSDQVTRKVEKGGGPMPGGLVAGSDLANVVAYVLSIQR